MITTTLPALQVRTGEPTTCPMCGQPKSAPKVIRVNAGTIADIYDVWPTRPSGKRIGPNLLVIELKAQS